MTLRVELKIAGFNELRNSPGIVADLRRRAKAIAEAAGEGFEVETASDGTRGRMHVVAVSMAAKRAEATGAALTQAIDAGRA